MLGSLAFRRHEGDCPRAHQARVSRGEVPEWSIGAVSKTVVPLAGYRGFESLPLRHSVSTSENRGHGLAERRTFPAVSSSQGEPEKAFERPKRGAIRPFFSGRLPFGSPRGQAGRAEARGDTRVPRQRRSCRGCVSGAKR
jgi:hypothetical protein